ncbi:hypothetical protein GW17_00013333 [Ensete ventricosum]|nr:hypothetical protein GW17_00013333 [Ensete ventricosum]
MSWRSAPETELLPYEECAANIRELGAHLKAVSSPASVNPVATHSLASALEQQIFGRKSISDDPSVSTLCKQCQDQDYGLAAKSQKPLEDEKYETDDQLVLHNTSSQVNTKNTKTLFCLHICCILPCSWLRLKRSKRQEAEIKMDIAGILASTEEMHAESSEGSNVDRVLPIETDGRSVLTNPSNIYQLYETKIASLTRKNALLEEQLKAALTCREAAEKNLSSAVKSKQEVETKLADTVKEVELLKEKLAAVELVQEEANSLSNMVHSDNVRLEHDVAFLKAILDDTQKARPFYSCSLCPLLHALKIMLYQISFVCRSYTQRVEF